MFLLLQGQDSASGTSPESCPYPGELIICILCGGREWREMIPLCYKRNCKTDELGLTQCSKSITAQPGTAQVYTMHHTWCPEPCMCPRTQSCVEARKEFSCKGLRQLRQILSISYSPKKKTNPVPLPVLCSPGDQQHSHKRLKCPAAVSQHPAVTHPAKQGQWLHFPMVGVGSPSSGFISMQMYLHFPCNLENLLSS